MHEITGTVHVRRPSGELVPIEQLTPEERMALQRKLAVGHQELCYQAAERRVRERNAQQAAQQAQGA